MIDESIWDSFRNFKIYKDNKEIRFTELERKVIEDIENKQKGNYIVIYPKDNDYLLLLSIIYNAIKVSFFNIFQSESDILEVINDGDIIQYDKSLCKYRGRIGNNLKIQFSDGVIWLPITLRYKISPYNGTGTKLNKMPTKALSKNKKTKNLLAEIMNINIDEICKVGKKSILIVENKQRINNLLKSIEIKIGDNKKVALTEVFSMAYYSSVDNIYHYKGNYKKEDPIIKFTSKVYIANELCKKIKTINSVIFLPKKVILDDLEELKIIERRKNISNITTIARPIDIEKQINNEYFNEDFKVKILTNKFHDAYNITSFNERQYSYLRNYTKELINIKSIDDKTSSLRKKINDKCLYLRKLFENDEDITKYIISIRKFIKRVLTIPIPIDNFDELIKVDLYTETTAYLFSNIKITVDILEQRALTSEVNECIKLIYNLAEEIYKVIKERNIKWDELSKIVTGSNSENILIASDNKIIRTGIKRYIEKFFPYRTNVRVGKIKDKNYDKVVFAGLLEENLYNNYRVYSTNQVKCIFYKFEHDLLKYLKNRYEKFLKQSKDEEIEDNNIIENDLVLKEIDLGEITRELELENKIEEFLITEYTHSEKSLSDDGQSLMECSKVLKFSDGRRAFITKQFNAYELDEEREEIVIRKPNELSIGQILLFVDDINKDIVESTLKDIIKIPKIKDIYDEPYNMSKQWKVILRNYIEKNELTYNDLSIKIKKNGISRTASTIRGWLVDLTVGPQEIEVFKALAEITNDKYFLEKYKEIYNSCNLIRSFQIKVRKAIAKKLLRINVSEDNDEIDNIIMENCGQDFNYVVRVEVEKIFNIEKCVPAYLTNTVLEG